MNENPGYISKYMVLIDVLNSFSCPWCSIITKIPNTNSCSEIAYNYCIACLGYGTAHDVDDIIEFIVSMDNTL